MSPRPVRRFLAAALSLAAVTAAAGCAAEPSPEVAVRHFLLDWQSGDYEDAARQTDGDPAEVAEALRQAHDQLDLAALRLGLGPIAMDGGTATAAFQVQADLGIGDPVWRYEGSIPLARTPGGWAISWSPAVIHPDLGEGERLAVTYDVPDRGQIFDREGEPLVGETRVTAFGVRPATMEDMTAGVNSLAELLDEDPEPLLNRVRSAPPDEFQPLVLKRTSDVSDELKAKATRIPGVETAKLSMPLTPKTAPAVVGEVAGTAEHKVSSRVSGPYQAGDTVGLSGLQSSYQQWLAGTATTRIVTLGPDGEETDVLESWAGVESGSLHTTIDSTVQTAAEDSLATVTTTAHLVAVDARSGEILAAAGRPGDTANDGAFTGEYLPGEVFTVVSAATLLDSGGLRTDTPVPCEQSRKVGDRVFTNPSGGMLQGTPDLRRDFAYSCTTAFAGLADRVDGAAVAETAADFGIGAPWQLSVPAFSGEVTAPAGAEATAAAIVGADGVRVSPLAMALAAGAVADGRWHAPRLVQDEQQEQTEPSVELDPGVVEPLREMMRAAVQEGSASAANIDFTNPVHAQTGTARQDIDGQETSVQWFVGYQGHLAFAVVVETPITHTYQFALNSGVSFLQALPFDYIQALGGGEARDDSAEQSGGTGI